MDAKAVYPVIGAASGLALFLPSLDATWVAHPADAEHARRLRSGEALYLVTVLAIAGLAAADSGSSLPLLAGLIAAGAVVLLYEHAFADHDEPVPAPPVSSEMFQP